MAAISRHPGFELLEGLRAQRVEALLSVGAHLHDPRLRQDPQVPGNAGLVNVHAFDDVADGAFARLHRLDDTKAGWIGEGEVAIPTLIECCKEPDLHYDSRLKLLTALSRSGPEAETAVPAVLEMTKVDSIEAGNRGGEEGRRGNARAQIQAARFLDAFGETERAAAILHRLAKDRDPQIATQAATVLAPILPAIQPAGMEPAP